MFYSWEEDLGKDIVGKSSNLKWKRPWNFFIISFSPELKFLWIEIHEVETTIFIIYRVVDVDIIWSGKVKRRRVLWN